jgi:splicing factor 3B subunit 2
MTYPYQYIFDRKRDIGQEVNSSNKRKSILDVQKEKLFSPKARDESLVEIFSDYFSCLATSTRRVFNGQNKKMNHLITHDKNPSLLHSQEETIVRTNKFLGNETGLSRKKTRLMCRDSIVKLKEKSGRPETVEIWDVSAPDPMTLIQLKAYRNSIPVPRHWSQKRRYLLGKRGIEKPPFELPDFIEATGIHSLRNVYQEKEDNKKQNAREKVRPKINKLNLNYEVMRDAFFKYQTKSKITCWGQIYFEGKEFEPPEHYRDPGSMSDKLKGALGMGSNSCIPPPWLINMQRYGLPPSYPGLKLPGLNAEIPAGCRFGYGPGEWGKPHLDFYKSSYTREQSNAKSEGEIENSLNKAFEWGKMEEFEEQTIGENVSSENREEIRHDEKRQITPTHASSSLPDGMETPEVIHLRKDDNSMETPEIVRHQNMI